MFPWLDGPTASDELQGGVGLPGEAVGDDGGLSAVQEPLTDATVLLGMGDRLLPLACADEGPDALGEEDSPQPRADCLKITIGAGEVLERDVMAIDIGCAAAADGVEEGGEQEMAAGAVVVADGEPGKVDERLQSKACPGRVQRPSGLVGGEVLPAQGAGHLWEAAVARDQCRLVQHLGGQRERVRVSAVGGGTAEIAQLGEARLKGKAGRAGARDQREALCGLLQHGVHDVSLLISAASGLIAGSHPKMICLAVW